MFKYVDHFVSVYDKIPAVLGDQMEIVGSLQRVNRACFNTEVAEHASTDIKEVSVHKACTVGVLVGVNANYVVGAGGLT